MDIRAVLKRLNLKDTGTYNNHFYVIELENSDAYASMYSQLSQYAINTEEPNFAVNSAKTTTKITNYFEITENNISYNIFLIADFDNDSYYLRIGEK